MKVITKKAMTAFNNNFKFVQSNTSVLVFGDTTEMYLFGNRIAYKFKEDFYIQNAGWFTNTTKERLNALPGVSIKQKKGVWYLNGKEWDGKYIRIN